MFLGFQQVELITSTTFLHYILWEQWILFFVSTLELLVCCSTMEDQIYEVPSLTKFVISVISEIY